MKLIRRHAKRGRVEIIPMIDTILILLIFYMSFSQFKVEEKRIDAKLPITAKASAVASVKLALDISLKVKDKNEVIVNGANTISLADLRGYMAQFAMVGQEEITVVIDAEPTTSYEDVVGALDACALAKLKKVAFRPLADAAAPAK
jgi:biopolymer transport protein ExbD